MSQTFTNSAVQRIMIPCFVFARQCSCNVAYFFLLFLFYSTTALRPRQVSVDQHVMIRMNFAAVIQMKQDPLQVWQLP